MSSFPGEGADALVVGIGSEPDAGTLDSVEPFNHEGMLPEIPQFAITRALSALKLSVSSVVERLLKLQFERDR